MDADTKQVTEYFAKVIFLLRVDPRHGVHPAELDVGPISRTASATRAASSGHNLMDHHFCVGAMGSYRRASRTATTAAAGRTASTSRASATLAARDEAGVPARLRLPGQREPRLWGDGAGDKAFGVDVQGPPAQPGRLGMMLNGFGECLPNHENA